MIRKIAAVGLSTALLAALMFANEGAVPKDVPRLDHVFVIVMENHGYSQIIGNPDTPFANSYANSANTATSYFAVAHPSLTNYLEVVGGSNFGVQSDNNPDWHNARCTTNLASATASPASSSAEKTTTTKNTETGTDRLAPANGRASLFAFRKQRPCPLRTRQPRTPILHLFIDPPRCKERFW